MKAKNNSDGFILNNYISNSLFNWSNLSNLSKSTQDLEKIDQRFENLKKIQNVFLHCYFESPKTDNLFVEITSSQQTDFSRYNYFHASYSISNGSEKNARKIIETALISNPRNLLLNQFKNDLNGNKNIPVFNCKKKTQVVAEILYIAANALASQSIYTQSNFFLNLSKYLNEDFVSYDTLLAENFITLAI